MDSGKGSANSDGKGPLTGRLFVYCVFSTTYIHKDGTKSEGGGDGGCWQVRCEGVGEGERRWESRMGPKVKVEATAGAGR